MGYRPITYCRGCGEAFEEYTAPEDRVCDSCKEMVETEVEVEIAKRAIAEIEADPSCSIPMADFVKSLKLMN
jgi:hypothetical protein